jgi:hypothetical protein
MSELCSHLLLCVASGICFFFPHIFWQVIIVFVSTALVRHTMSCVLPFKEMDFNWPSYHLCMTVHQQLVRNCLSDHVHLWFGRILKLMIFIVVPSKSFIYQLVHCLILNSAPHTHTHTNTDLIKYAATPPNQPQWSILTDYSNNNNFSKLK